MTRSLYKRHGIAVDALSAVIVFLSCFVLINFLIFQTVPKLDVGVDSEWVYNVYIGGGQGLATHWYEEKLWVDSLVYCDKLLCYKMVRNNPTYLQTDYVTGDRFLVRSVIVDKEDGSVFDIVYVPPMLQRPSRMVLGSSWTTNSLAVVTHVSGDIVRTERVELPEVEAQVVETLLLSGESGKTLGLIVEERSNGVLVRKSVYSDAVHAAVRFELPISKVWGELVAVNLRQPSLQDFLRIDIYMGFELVHIILITVMLLVIRLVFSKSFFIESMSVKGRGDTAWWCSTLQPGPVTWRWLMLWLSY